MTVEIAEMDEQELGRLLETARFAMLKGIGCFVPAKSIAGFYLCLMPSTCISLCEHTAEYPERVCGCPTCHANRAFMRDYICFSADKTIRDFVAEELI